MMKIVLSFFVMIFFTSCSMKTPPNQWEHKAKNATESYIKNFLSDKELLASKDFDRAVEHAKSSADFTTLAKVYLTKCALEIIVGEQNGCEEYTKIETLLNNKEFMAYKQFLNGKILSEDVGYLPLKYQDFAKNYLSKEYQKAINILEETQDIVSMLVMASLLKENLTEDTITKVINIASFYGYTKASKYWLGYKAIKFEDIQSQEILKVLEK